MSVLPEYQAPESQSNALFEQHAELVSRVAYHTVVRLPAGQTIDDYIQVGMLGLWEASKRYQEGAAASFKTFASIYIRGAILDELRRQSWAPRGVQAKAKQIAQAIKTTEARVGRHASATEIAEEMGESLEDYHAMLAETAGSSLVSLDEFDGDYHELECADSPESSVLDSSLKERIVQLIDTLPEREKLVISLYYQEEMNLREIGEVIGVGESRVCQIHSQAMKRLRSRLEEEW